MAITASQLDKASTSPQARRRPPAPLTLYLLLLFSPVLLPLLFLSLIFLAFFFFLLFLPVACTVASSFILWTVLRPRTVAASYSVPGFSHSDSECIPTWRPSPLGPPECIDFDHSEVPCVDGTDQEEDRVAGAAEAIAISCGEDDISVDLSFWQMYLVRPVKRASGKKRFLELLSFWQTKERGRPGEEVTMVT